MAGLGVLQGRAAGFDGLRDRVLELPLDLVEGLALGDELRVLVGELLHHLADAHLGSAEGRLDDGDVGIGADLRDVADRAAGLLVAGDDRHEDLVLVDLLAGLLAVLDEHGALGGQGVGVLGDRKELLVLDELVLLFVKTADLVVEGLDLDTGLLHERIGDHQAVIFAVFLDGLAEKAGDLTGEVAVRVGEVDVDDEGLTLRGDPALLGEDFLFGERTREDVAGLVGLEDELALRRGETA